MLMNFLALMLPEKEIFRPGPGGKSKNKFANQIGDGKKTVRKGKKLFCSLV